MEREYQNNAVRQSVKSSFSELVREAAEQIDMREFTLSRPGLADQARELCAIIAEVYAMRPEAEIYIAGERLYAGLVSDVFRTLTFEHAEHVLDNYNRATYVIRNKRVYLRTSLYNSVFELAASIANDIASG